MEEPFAQAAKQIAGRTVAIVCQGPSAPFVKEVGRKDWCYASINRARLVEDLCPNPLEIVYCVSEDRLSQEAPWLDAFPGIVISTDTGKRFLKRDFGLLEKKDQRGFWVMNTLSVFLFFLMKAGVKDIVIFGCDGTAHTYYRVKEYSHTELNSTVLNDSGVMNKQFWEVAREVSPDWEGSIKLAGPKKWRSTVTCFPTVDEEGINRLYPLVPAQTDSNV